MHVTRRIGVPRGYVRVGKDLVLFRDLEFRNGPDDETPFDGDIEGTITWDEDAEEYRVSRLLVTARAGGPPITGTMLRAIPLHSIVRTLVDVTARYLVPTPTPSGGYEIRELQTSEQEWDRLGAQGPTPETLDWVARTYLLAKAQLEPPTKAVADTFKVTSRTATYWVKLARERGHFGPA